MWDDAAPNAAVCPTCLGHPGTLPSLNEAAITLGVRAGLALGCAVHTRSTFFRKHYFYPDLPKGYQITQGDLPLCGPGRLHVELDGSVRAFALRRIHLEEDAGRLRHDDDGTRVDWGRAGVPLIEIVGEPDLRTPEEAEAWVRALRRVLVAGKICQGDMEHGHLRCDANVSVAPAGEPPGARVELKNLHSPRAVAAALRAEIARQTAQLLRGEPIAPGSRTWDGERSLALRDKPTTADYRFMPEPDLPPLALSPALLAAARAGLPATPLDRWLLDQDAARRDALARDARLGPAEARALAARPELCSFYDAAVAAGGAPPAMARWVLGDLSRAANAAPGGLADSPMRPEALARLPSQVDPGALSLAAARGLFDVLFTSGADPEALIKAMDIRLISDEGALRRAASEILLSHPAEVARYRDGQRGLSAFFTGQLMRAFQGQADPRLVSRIVLEALERE